MHLHERFGFDFVRYGGNPREVQYGWRDTRYRKCISVFCSVGFWLAANEHGGRSRHPFAFAA